MGVLAKPIPFGDYFLLEKINTGGMAEVYKAKTFGVEGFERIVAVKKILPSIAEDSEFISMFIDEAKIAVQLTHANIAQIFDLGCIDGQYYIAMEYVPGRDLRVIYERCVRTNTKMDIACVCYIISKLCEGLDYAHNKKDANGEPLGIVHRDISPQNVLISYDGECKLIDFGIAKAANKSSATQVGILKGKFSYMSPEQVSGKTKIDRRSDVFALGIVLFEMLTLKRLFLGSSDFSTLEKIRKVEVSPPTLYNPDIPEDLEDIVMKALQKDVNERYQTAAELQQDLQKFMFRHNMYYTAKDLSEFSRKLFAQEIALEQQKMEFYRELTKDVLEQSRAPQQANAEDETSFYDRHHVPVASGIKYDAVSAQSAPKQAIYAELDDFQPPTDGIVYSNKPSNSMAGMAAVQPQQVNLANQDSLAEMASKPLQIDKSMPAARKSMSGMAPVVAANGKDRETVVSSSSSKTRKSSAAFRAIIVLLVVIIVSLCVIFVITKYDPRDGRVNFKFQPEGVEIELFVDGHRVAGADGKPLVSGSITLDKLLRKSETTYVVTAEGYETIEDSFTATQSGVNLPVQLKPLQGNLKLIVNVPGATVRVDGKDIEGDQEFAVSGLTPGEHFVHITKDRYQSIEKKITVGQGSNNTLTFSLDPKFASLQLNSDPDGAEFTLRNKSTGEIWHVKSGEIVNDLPIHDKYEISYRDHDEVRVIPWQPKENGELDKRMYAMSAEPVVVKPEPVAAAAPSAPTRARTSGSSSRSSGSSGASSGSSSKAQAVAPSTPEAPPAPPKPAAAAASNSGVPGIFKILSKPPCEIFINGKSYGMTPKKITDLPAGKYKIRFVNAEAGIDSEQTEVLNPNEETKVVRK